MPNSRSSSLYTRSNHSPDRPSTAGSISTAATSANSSRFSSFRRKPTPNQHKARPRSVPGDWNTLLGIPPEHSNTSSQRSSLSLADSYADLIGAGIKQDAPSTKQELPIYNQHARNIKQDASSTKVQAPSVKQVEAPCAMGGNRTSQSMNGALDGKRRTQTYEEQYQYKDNVYGSARERVHRESPVIGELRTNVIIKDEFTLVTDMSYHLAARYSRPDSSIMINVDHSSCLALAGTFEPCYILTISTVPSQMQASTNKRNAALIQSFMADILSVPPERGIIKFVSIPEENYAVNGNTLFGEIERLEQKQFSNGGMKRAMTDVRKSMPNFKKSSVPKLDLEFAKIADRADGFDGHMVELQNGITSAPQQSEVPDVFELAGPGNGQRPSTSHGGSHDASFTSLHNLRLNSLPREDLEGPGTRTSFGRPKTISGAPVWSSERTEPLPGNNSDDAAPPPISKPEPRQTQRAKDHHRTASSPDIKPQRPILKSAISSSNSVNKTKPAYLENPKPSLVKGHSRKNSKSPEALPQDDTTAANTAKRRSSVIATPVAGKTPQPPPVPEAKQAKVSKRKSFFSAFKK